MVGDTGNQEADINAHVALGRAYAALGQLEAAFDGLNRALKMACSIGMV